jgi:hypothetical protein
MSDSYIQFSFEVPLCTPEIKSWASEFLSYPERHGKFSDYTGFEWDTWANNIHIWADENGNTEDVVTFLSELLDQPHYKERTLGFSYSYTCSQPEVGAFGGGAVKVTKTPEGTDINYIDTEQWLAV